VLQEEPTPADPKAKDFVDKKKEVAEQKI